MTTVLRFPTNRVRRPATDMPRTDGSLALAPEFLPENQRVTFNDVAPQAWVIVEVRFFLHTSATPSNGSGKQRRMWTMDSFEGTDAEPLSLHKFTYANGNPVNGTDPSGKATLIGVLSTVAAISFITSIPAALFVRAWNLRDIRRIRVAFYTPVSDAEAVLNVVRAVLPPTMSVFNATDGITGTAMNIFIVPGENVDGNKVIYGQSNPQLGITAISVGSMKKDLGEGIESHSNFKMILGRVLLHEIGHLYGFLPELTDRNSFMWSPVKEYEVTGNKPTGPDIINVLVNQVHQYPDIVFQNMQ